jgi:hypothetical protein
MPLMAPMAVLDVVSRDRSEEAAVFFFPARCRPPYAMHYRRSLLRVDVPILNNL